MQKYVLILSKVSQTQQKLCLIETDVKTNCDIILSTRFVSIKFLLL